MHWRENPFSHVSWYWFKSPSVSDYWCPCILNSIATLQVFWRWYCGLSNGTHNKIGTPRQITWGRGCKPCQLMHKAKKKNCYVALTRPKFENWSVGRFFYIFFYVPWESWVFQYFLKVSKWGKLGRNAVKTHIQVLGHWIQILANSSPKSDIFQKKTKKKNRPCFFAFYGRSGEGNITNFFFGLMVSCQLNGWKCVSVSLIALSLATAPVALLNILMQL